MNNQPKSKKMKMDENINNNIILEKKSYYNKLLLKLINSFNFIIINYY